MKIQLYSTLLISFLLIITSPAWSNCTDDMQDIKSSIIVNGPVTLNYSCTYAQINKIQNLKQPNDYTCLADCTNDGKSFQKCNWIPDNWADSINDCPVKKAL